MTLHHSGAVSVLHDSESNETLRKRVFSYLVARNARNGLYDKRWKADRRCIYLRTLYTDSSLFLHPALIADACTA